MLSNAGRCDKLSPQRRKSIIFTRGVIENSSDLVGIIGYLRILTVEQKMNVNGNLNLTQAVVECVEISSVIIGKRKRRREAVVKFTALLCPTQVNMNNAHNSNPLPIQQFKALVVVARVIY